MNEEARVRHAHALKALMAMWEEYGASVIDGEPGKLADGPRALQAAFIVLFSSGWIDITGRRTGQALTVQRVPEKRRIEVVAVTPEKPDRSLQGAS